MRLSLARERQHLSRSSVFEQEIARLRQRRIAAVGLGISNMSVVEFLRSVGCDVVALDRSSADQLGKGKLARLEALGVEYHLGDSYLEDLDKYDEIFISPGVSPHIPEIQQAVRRGASINGEINLFLRVCGSPVVGITGSAGKTTTASLVASVINHSGRKCILAGNIGAEILSRLDSIDDDAVVVLELSSFQLQVVDSSPWIGAILNLAPNHLDHHKSLDEYYRAKENIIRFQTQEDYAVLNCDDPRTRSLAGEFGGMPRLYGLQPMDSDGAYLVGDDLVYRSGDTTELVCKRSDIPLLGEHNLSNCLAAILMGRICGVCAERIREAIRSFRGVEHRLELLCHWHGIAFYNDSIATSPDRTIAAIRAIDGPVVLIAGGYDKNLDYDELGRVIVREVRSLVLVGQASAKIRRSVEKAVQEHESSNREVTLRSVHQASSFDEAVELAVSQAKAGDAVLLSPACASFDMFKSYKDRGDAFRRLVDKLTTELS